MNRLPAKVDATCSSLKLRRSCTGAASSDSYAAEATKQARADVVVTVRVVVRVGGLTVVVEVVEVVTVIVDNVVAVTVVTEEAVNVRPMSLLALVEVE